MNRISRISIVAGLVAASVLVIVGAPAAPAADAATGHGATGARASFHDAMRQSTGD